jgi:hypothetical protein
MTGNEQTAQTSKELIILGIVVRSLSRKKTLTKCFSA